MLDLYLKITSSTANSILTPYFLKKFKLCILTNFVIVFILSKKVLKGAAISIVVAKILNYFMK